MSTQSPRRATLDRHHITRARRDSQITDLVIDSLQNRVAQEYFSYLESCTDISDREKSFRKARKAVTKAVAKGTRLSSKDFEQVQAGIRRVESAILRQMAPRLASACRLSYA